MMFPGKELWAALHVQGAIGGTLNSITELAYGTYQRQRYTGQNLIKFPEVFGMWSGIVATHAAVHDAKNGGNVVMSAMLLPGVVLERGAAPVVYSDFGLACPPPPGPPASESEVELMTHEFCPYESLVLRCVCKACGEFVVSPLHRQAASSISPELSRALPPRQSALPSSEPPRALTRFEAIAMELAGDDE